MKNDRLTPPPISRELAQRILNEQAAEQFPLPVINEEQSRFAATLALVATVVPIFAALAFLILN